MINALHKLKEDIKPEYFFWGAVVCSLFFVFNSPTSAAQNTTASVADAIEMHKENPYASLELLANAVYVYDVKSEKPLFEKNGLQVLPLASVAKIMTAMTALSLIPDTTYITITERAIQEEGDSGLNAGERWLLRDLLKFLLVESSNDGAVAVSSAVGAIVATSTSTKTEDEYRGMFIEEMNKLASSIGLASTHFQNESGLDIDKESSGAESSAKETARMLAYALLKFPGVFQETRWSELVLQSEDGKPHPAENTNKEIGNFPLLIASKTGYTDLAGGNLVLAFDAGFNNPIIISVLGSTMDGRFTDAEQLVWATLAYLQQQ